MIYYSFHWLRLYGKYEILSGMYIYKHAYINAVCKYTKWEIKMQLLRWIERVWTMNRSVFGIDDIPHPAEEKLTKPIHTDTKIDYLS